MSYQMDQLYTICHCPTVHLSRFWDHSQVVLVDRF